MTNPPSFRVLVTGFGPYGNTDLNPSLAVVRQLQQQKQIVVVDNDNIEIIAKQVSSEFNKCIDETVQYIDELNPDAVICMGEYPGRSQITVERVAINYNDSTRYGLCDEAGFAPQGTPVVDGGPTAYITTLPIRRIVQDMRFNGIPADISGDAGTLMCNHLMYGVLHHVQTKVDNKPIPAGWIHLPALPETAALECNILANMPSMSADTSTKAILSAIKSIVVQVQNEKDEGGDIDVPIRSRLLV